MFAKETKILVVDDMKTMRMSLKNKLKKLGLENVEEADDGQTAWPKIQTAANSGQPFDLILSDWNMPQMQGIDLLRLVRADGKLKKTPFVLVTAESEKAQVMQAVQLGVTNYLTKPFTEDSLREKLEIVYKTVSQ